MPQNWQKMGPVKSALVRISLNQDLQSSIDSRHQDMNLPGYRLHQLKGDRKDMWSVSVNGNWRMTFYFEAMDAYLVDYMDYH